MKHNELLEPAPSSRRLSQGEFAVRFFQAGTVAVAASLGVTWGLLKLLPPSSTPKLTIPPAFGVTTMLLIGVSAVLHFAVRSVRRERQRPFRWRMLAGLVCGIGFIGVQGYGIAGLLQVSNSAEAQTGSLAFVAVFTALHCLHVTVALLFLVYVTLQSFADRYDHEYYWGVTVCTWFWHALGVVWLAILAVFAIVM